MTRGSNVQPEGRIRRSQLVNSFGPGALVDLPRHSVIIGGLDTWGNPDTNPAFHFIHEPRLLSKVIQALKMPNARLVSPPIDLGQAGNVPSGITAWQFPEWFVVQKEEASGPDRHSRRLVHRRQLENGRFREPKPKGKLLPVVPVRFVRACINGHIGDVPWYSFVHEDKEDCRRQIWLTERGTSGDLADVFVRCDCGRARSLATALPGPDRQVPLGFCDGSRPWLGARAKEPCEEKAKPNRLLVRTASNAYFPQILSVIHIPEGDEALNRAVGSVWEDFLSCVEEKQELVRERRRPRVAAALDGFSDDMVWAEIGRRNQSDAPAERSISIKQAEVETLLSDGPTLGEDKPGSCKVFCV